MPRVLRALAAAAAAAGALAVAPAAFAAGQGLSGESFGTPDVMTISAVQCDPSGTSSFAFTVRGPAFGPYAGTYHESGTITFGPQNLPSTPRLRNFGAGPVLTLDVTFSIDSTAGQVNGTKTLVAPASAALAACAGGPAVFVPEAGEVCSDVDTQSLDVPQLNYSATISTATGTSSDSGATSLYLSHVHALCPSFSGVCCGDSFTEEFFTLTPIDTPGTASGGGEVDPTLTATGIAFGFYARSDGQTFRGGCAIRDRTTGTRVICRDVESFVRVGNHVTFTGLADVNGVTTRYRIDVTDGGNPNSGMDTFAVQTDSGYAGGGPVTRGDVRVSA